ncbi:MAG: RdgB/HAM1 family non-canonical purine NTP pyrophosphatase [Ignavibacteriota bacterium]|jgi:XTP/dITP diphosphohydrolase|nr:MAG: RdgB/HAM1 family non-canonical purine NTP pyrophosphatase [Ignavibacterium sp.]MBL1154237.1 RdgB/HAM1 family non-canonical purine NTP pyrophosphatase [Ignavibacteriota bacterium]MCO6448797.1 RdgB/HAM1 family non-canonical purine NTP pyrophosphatase [Ignavibacterium album]MDX9710911.1 RdgB/HAM1 family non-canonical purine NTP pyrophosphatase [Ignavibacteriaceae bacterium]MEB2355535.1 RdgB/HAM1 family non-canonical purine NTP pyrophosphatase [Ignavibacteriales bacterium]
MKQIILATTNKGKLNDVKEIFNDLDIEILSFLDFENHPEVEENGNTFSDNAIIKARAAFEKYKIPSIGDDSGLEAFQLNGEPGIYSARYAGENADDEKNNLLLIKKLSKLPEPHPGRFVCAAAYYDGKEIKTAIGEIRGNIIKTPRGKNGFGYDPLFIPDGYNITTAEMPHEEKNKISHRYNAFKQLRILL